jgi:5'-nucleotidase
MMNAMNLMGTDVVGVGPGDLRYGLSFLESEQRHAQLPIVSANLRRRADGATVFAPYLIKKVGRIRVGVFGLISDLVSLGPSAESLLVEDPTIAARRTVAELRSKGANVVVLLSQLGQNESNNLISQVPGIDAVVAGHEVPVIARGKRFNSTTVVYGGQGGEYLGKIVIDLKGRKVKSSDGEVIALGPLVRTRLDIRKLVSKLEGFPDDRLGIGESD